MKPKDVIVPTTPTQKQVTYLNKFIDESRLASILDSGVSYSSANFSYKRCLDVINLR